MQNTILEVSDLCKFYREEQGGGIQNIHFKLNKGEILSVIGESGSGKSTLLKCLYGLLELSSGGILFNNEPLKGPSMQLVPGCPDMKYVAQDFSLNLYATVYDNVASVLSNTDIRKKETKTLEVMQYLNIGAYRNRKIVELSGGEQQRVAIARALVAEPQVLLLDEPFSQIDSILKNQLRNDIRNLAVEKNIAVILVSHDPADGLFMNQQLMILKEGRSVQQGAVSSLYNNPASPYVAALLGNAVILTHAEATEMGLKTAHQEIAIYPEWVSLKKSWSSRSYEVKEVYHKGFVSELLLESKGVLIRAYQFYHTRHKKNDRVQVCIDRFVEF